MKNKGILISSIIFITVGLLGIISLSLFSGVSTQRSFCGSGTGMMGDLDRQFIEEMIPHHEDAVLMAELALKKSDNEDLLKLAENIKREQSREIEEMRSWYKLWYGTDVPESAGGMSQGMMGGMTDFESLEKAELFDKEFIEQMIPHHQMALMMVSMMLQGTKHEELKKLAQDIVRTQTEEINQMNAWYNEWY
ncbi:MAG: DUF305 domain-containing protein [Actinobacteria bacterium]|nr:DUF305 domain-containing protein [Actinomycetota bacterium]